MHVSVHLKIVLMNTNDNYFFIMLPDQSPILLLLKNSLIMPMLQTGGQTG